MTEKRIELMVPTGEANVEDRVMAERPRELEEKVLGILCNRKHNADLLLNRLMEQLSGRYKISETFFAEKEAATPTPETVLNQLKEKCDIVLNAVGD